MDMTPTSMAMATATPTSSMAMGGLSECKISVQHPTPPGLSTLELTLAPSMTDALELVHSRCMLPLPKMAHHLQRHVRRLLHRHHRPRAPARMPPPSAARIRPLDPAPAPATLYQHNRRHPCLQSLKSRQQRQYELRRRRQHGDAVHTVAGRDSPCAYPQAASRPRGSPHDAVCRCVYHHASGDVLQWVHHRLHLPRGLHRLYDFLVGCPRCHEYVSLRLP